jgi:hypothetical protein
MAKRGSTRIFEVGFFTRNLYDGKALKGEGPQFERMKVVAVDGEEAITVVGDTVLTSESSYVDEDTKKTVIVTRKLFDPVQVELLAEA